MAQQQESSMYKTLLKVHIGGKHKNQQRKKQQFHFITITFNARNSNNAPSFHMSTCTKFKQMQNMKHNINSWYTTYTCHHNSTKSGRKTRTIITTKTTKRTTTDRQEQDHLTQSTRSLHRTIIAPSFNMSTCTKFK